MNESIITSISEKWVMNSIHKGSSGDMIITVDTYALIMDTNTKEITNVKNETWLLEPNWQPFLYSWESGNNSCDCNRYLYVCRATGATPIDCFPCTDGQYLVNLYNAKNNSVIYSEY
jgi:hypothetical protein